MLRKLSSSIWAMLEYLWSPLIAIVCTPFFLTALGPEKYGLWALMAAAVGSGAIFNAATGAATIKHISAETLNNQPAKLEGAIRGSLTIALLGGGVVAAGTVAIFWLVGMSALASAPLPATT